MDGVVILTACCLRLVHSRDQDVGEDRQIKAKYEIEWLEYSVEQLISPEFIH